MNKIALYIFIVLIFLAAIRGFVPDFKSKSYIEDESSYLKIFKDAPVSAILLDAYEMGFILKSYIHSYRVFKVFERSRTITFRVSHDYFQKTLGYIGLSLFRRSEGEDDRGSTVPVPPGSLFVGKPSYGSWRYKRGEREKVWVFYRRYRYFNQEFFWGDFLPNRDFYRALNRSLEENKVFRGLNNEFGSEGVLTQSRLSLNWYKNQNKKYSFGDYFNMLSKLPIGRSR